MLMWIGNSGIAQETETDLSGQEAGSQEQLELKTAEESGLAAILGRSSRAEGETKGTNLVRAAAS